MDGGLGQRSPAVNLDVASPEGCYGCGRPDGHPTSAVRSRIGETVASQGLQDQLLSDTQEDHATSRRPMVVACDLSRLVMSLDKPRHVRKCRKKSMQ